jgi:hypothetical protein
VHKAEVRVDEASINARYVLLRPYRFARSDNRISQGDLKHTLALDRAVGGLRLSVSNEPVVQTAGAFGSGSGVLRAKGKTATLHCLRLDPVGPDMY